MNEVERNLAARWDTIAELRSLLLSARSAAIDVLRLAEDLAEDFADDVHRWDPADSEKFQRLWEILADIDETLKAQS